MNTKTNYKTTNMKLFKNISIQEWLNKYMKSNKDKMHKAKLNL